MEGLCEVVGREDVCGVVELGRLLPRGGSKTGLGLLGEPCSLRFPRALSEGRVSETCSCAVLKLSLDERGEELSVVRAANFSPNSSILSSRGS